MDRTTIIAPTIITVTTITITIVDIITTGGIIGRIAIDRLYIETASGTRGWPVLSALRAQNVQVSAGALNQPPVVSATGAAYQISVQALGRLTTPEQFGDIIVKSDSQGRVTRIRDTSTWAPRITTP